MNTPTAYRFPPGAANSLYKAGDINAICFCQLPTPKAEYAPHIADSVKAGIQSGTGTTFNTRNSRYSRGFFSLPGCGYFYHSTHARQRAVALKNFFCKKNGYLFYRFSHRGNYLFLRQLRRAPLGGGWAGAPIRRYSFKVKRYSFFLCSWHSNRAALNRLLKMVFNPRAPVLLASACRAASCSKYRVGTLRSFSS